MYDWMMTPEEFKAEQQVRQKLADALLAKAKEALEKVGLEILDFKASTKECHDCLEAPIECGNCRTDRSMAEALRPQVATLVVAEATP